MRGYHKLAAAFAVLLVFSGLGCVSKKQGSGALTTIEGPTTTARMQDTAEGAEGEKEAGNLKKSVHKSFSIDMPADWTEVEYQNMIIYLPDGSEIADPLSEKIVVAVGRLPENNTVPLKDMLEDGVEDSKKLIPALAIVKEEETTLAGAGSTTGGIARFPLTNLNTQCRYIKSSATRGGDYWIFTDEIQIWGTSA